ncbi:hypothetical protein G7Y79_00016g040170 [Physcia stellaris]|nr:hypothetical protein G7Y79_00016g040170 [Physcia stellaris]
MPTDSSPATHQLQKLIVGIDFGTANSSVAYFIDKRTAHQRAIGLALGEVFISDLKSIDFDREPQIASQLAYDSKEEEWIWGSAVDELVEQREIMESDRIQMFKLCLENSSLAKSTRERVEGQLDRLPALAWEKLGHPDMPWPERLVSLYLKMLWHDSRERMRSSGVILEDYEVDCYIGVPKLWSPDLNQRMINAAIQAGLPTTLSLIHEPEAAAIFCFRGIARSSLDLSTLQALGLGDLQWTHLFNVQSTNIKVKDLVTYRLATQDRDFLIDEGVRGNAGLYGSGILNHMFLKLFRSRLRQSDATDAASIHMGRQKKYTALQNSAIDFEALKQFEERKKNFGSAISKNLKKPFWIRVEDSEARYAMSRNRQGYGEEEIPWEDIKELFDELIRGILSMLKEQVLSFNRHILLVGGFSKNQYFYDSIVNACSGPDSFAGYHITVTKPAEPSSTLIARGALLRALHKPVGNKILALSYGIKRDEEYDPEQHGNVSCVKDEHEGFNKVRDRVKWLCKVNEKIPQNSAITLRARGYRFVPLTGPTSIREYIYRSYIHDRDHMKVNTPGIEKVGSLNIPFDNVDRSKYEKLEPARKYVKLEYEVQMIFDGVRFTYRLIVPPYGKFMGHNGQNAGGLCHEKYIDNVAGAFDVSGYRVRTIHQPTDHFRGQDDRTHADSDQYNLDQQFSRPDNDSNTLLTGPLRERATTNAQRRITSPGRGARQMGSAQDRIQERMKGGQRSSPQLVPSVKAKVPFGIQSLCTQVLSLILRQESSFARFDTEVSVDGSENMDWTPTSGDHVVPFENTVGYWSQPT